MPILPVRRLSILCWVLLKPNGVCEYYRMEHFPLISAVFVNWNRCDLLQAAIRSVLAQNYPFLEIIVVDNGSTDHSLEWLCSQNNIHLIKNQKNEGASRARNQGTQLAKGDYVLYMDSDAEILTPSALASLVEHMETHPDIAGGAGGIYSDQEAKTIWCYSPCTDWEGIFDPVMSTRLLDDPPALSTCFSVFRKNNIDAVGGFDEFYFYLFEDGDLCQQIKKQGFRFYIDPEVKVWHHYAEPGRTKRGQIEFHYYHEWLRHYYLLKNWGIYPYLHSVWAKVAHPKQVKKQFPYLSIISIYKIYLFRNLLLLLKYSFGILVEGKRQQEPSRVIKRC